MISGTLTANATVFTLALRRLRNFVRGNGQAARQAWGAIGRLYMQFIRGRFGRASAGSGAWPPLAPSTIRGRLRVALARKTFAGRGDLGPATRRTMAPVASSVPILIRTGRLMGSLSDGSSERIEEYLPDGIREGTSVPYSRYHQTGTSRMPARTIFVAPTGATNDKIISRLRQGLTESALRG